MAKWWKKTGLMVGLPFLILVLVITACAPGAPGEGRKEVVAGQFVALTGPLASTGVPEAYGRLDYFKYLNDHGGINGIKVNAKWQNSACIVPSCVLAFRRFKEAGAVVTGELCTACGEQEATMCPKLEIPVVHVVFTKLMLTEPERWVFGGSPGTSAEMV